MTRNLYSDGKTLRDGATGQRVAQAEHGDAIHFVRTDEPIDRTMAALNKRNGPSVLAQYQEMRKSRTVHELAGAAHAALPPAPRPSVNWFWLTYILVLSAVLFCAAVYGCSESI